MSEEDRELLDHMNEVEDFVELRDQFYENSIEYDQLDLAKQYEMIHSPFAKIESEY